MNQLTLSEVLIQGPRLIYEENLEGIRYSLYEKISLRHIKIFIAFLCILLVLPITSSALCIKIIDDQENDRHNQYAGAKEFVIFVLIFALLMIIITLGAYNEKVQNALIGILFKKSLSDPL